MIIQNNDLHIFGSFFLYSLVDRFLGLISSLEERIVNSNKITKNAKLFILIDR